MERLEVSGAVRPLYGSLGVKGLRFSKKKTTSLCDMRWCDVLFAVLSASRTQHSEKYTHCTHDMLSHHHITHNDVDFFTET